MSDPQVRTRFAPSPTGFMHVGNLRTALYAYLIAKSQGGKFVLRIEDTDQARYVPGAVEVIYKTLAAAGLEHDEGPDKDGGFGPYVQSERRELYRTCAEELVAKGAAYYCFCDKQEPDEEHEGDAPVSTGYDGRCRKLDAATVAANLAAGKPYVIRQKIDRDGTTAFHDLVFGDITIENKVLDDQILLKRDGMPTYNFANVVDDHMMGITHVVRGSEDLPSTPKYNLLYQAFGWEIPHYVHLPLIMGRNADGTVSKLSKRHGSVSFENLTSEGYLPEAIVNYIALLGWSSKTDREIFTLPELCECFNISGLNKAPAVFDYAKLAWLNGEYIKKLAPEAFAAAALPAAGFAGTPLESQWPLAASLLQSRVNLYSEIPEKTAFLHARPDFSAELYTNKKSKCDPAVAAAVLAVAIPALEKLANWDKDSLMNLLSGLGGETLHPKSVMWAVRIALAGQSVTPGGAVEIMLILGREESLKRLRTGIDA
ncbi:MAG: glutamate--tRNA ligase [Victivallaceae bacterium]|nr:glutamate--tRNA ligase [Victivallaceae bacterium]